MTTHQYYETHKEEVLKKNKEYRDNNKEKVQKHSREYYRTNKEYKQKVSKIYREKNKEKIKKQKHESYLRNKEKVKARVSRYRKNNIEKVRARQKKYMQRPEVKETFNRYSREWNKKRREIVIFHYGGKCMCCGESNIEFLTMDHINNDGAKHRKELKENGHIHIYDWIIKNDFPDTFQVLCMNCNWAKGKYKLCPHKKSDICIFTFINLKFQNI